AAALLAVSREVARYLERFPDTRGRVRVVPNGVNLQRFPPRAAASCQSGHSAFTIGFVGSLKPWHGGSVLRDAFARLPRRSAETGLMIVGEGPEQGRLAEDVCRRGLGDAVHFTGWVPPDDLPAMLASMDVAVAPYPDLPHFYFSPLKVYEYMAAGLPVVASRIGQLAQILRHEETGLLCPPGDSLALAAELERLRCDLALRKRLGAAARATALEKHTWDGIAGRILKFARKPALSPTVWSTTRNVSRI